MSSKIAYRPEIDGIRALAVLSVIFFHAEFSVFSGGFVGVDVFFVISGYLITSIILKDVEAGTFTFSSFYERRARRILPALFFMMLCCIPFAWMWMMPMELTAFAQSIAAVVTFQSNHLLLLQSGYFDTAAALKPLLHTWSLAVEEQFYLVFPIILLLMWRLGRKATVGSLAAVALASFAVCEYASGTYTDFNFFSALTRAWELMAGALCAFVFVKPHRLRDNLLSVLGLILVIFSIVWFNSSTRFPSIFALIPVFGTCLLILFAQGNTFVAGALAARPLVAIGLISYSTYLWHNPLFAFVRLYADETPGVGMNLLIVACSLAVGWLSWRYVETPFRRHDGFFRQGQKLSFAKLVMIVASVELGGSLALFYAPPFIVLSEPDLFRVNVGPQSPWSDCPNFNHVKTGDAWCRAYGNGDKSAVIWGDSHAGALAAAVQPVHGYRIFVISHDGCPPVPGVRRSDFNGTSGNCSGIENLSRYRDYISALTPSKIVLIGRWTLYQNGWWQQGKLQAATHFLTDEAADPANIKATASRAALEKHLVQFVYATSRTSRLYVVAQPLDLHFLSRRQILRLDSVEVSAAGEWHRAEESLNQKLSAAGAAILDTKAEFCSATTCRVRQDGFPLYSDDNHLSVHGALVQFKLIQDALRD